MPFTEVSLTEETTFTETTLTEETNWVPVGSVWEDGGELLGVWNGITSSWEDMG
jgi:hypothetical protein